MIEWNKVTWYSKLAAVILFLIVLVVGFIIGKQYEAVNSLTIQGNEQLPNVSSTNDSISIPAQENWSTFTNTPLGYSIKVPEEAVITTVNRSEKDKKPQEAFCVSIEYKEAFILLGKNPNAEDYPCGPTGVGVSIKTSEIIWIDGKSYETTGYNSTLLSEDSDDEMNMVLIPSAKSDEIQITYGIRGEYGQKMNLKKYVQLRNLVSDIVETYSIKN